MQQLPRASPGSYITESGSVRRWYQPRWASHCFSKACGERVLLPRVRSAEPDSLIIADGFSCRTMIEQETPRRALHLADVLALALDYGPDGPPRDRVPEAKRVARRVRELRCSTERAFGRAAAACIALGIALLFVAILAALGVADIVTRR